MESDELGRSLRRDRLERVAADLARLDVRVPRCRIVPAGQFPDGVQDIDAAFSTCAAWVNAASGAFAASAAALGSEALFVRAQPLDEALAPELSFAGVYTSCAPIQGAPMRDNIARGLAHVFAGRRTAYAEYYYARHRIAGRRRIDVMISALADDATGFGTGYSDGKHVVFEYQDTALHASLKWPKRRQGTGGDALERHLAERLLRISAFLGEMVDVEFLITQDRRMIVSQVRRLSLAHRLLWEALPDAAWEAVGPVPDCILANPAAQVCGKAVDLRRRRPQRDDFDDTTRIFIVSRRPQSDGCDALGFLRAVLDAGVDGIRVVVEHAGAITCDHVAYVMREDPAIALVADVKSLPLDAERIVAEGGDISVKTSGFAAALILPDGASSTTA